jgi:hypothetical protein
MKVSRSFLARGSQHELEIAAPHPAEFAAFCDGDGVGGVTPEQSVREVTDDGEVLARILGSDPGLVLGKADVEDPVQTVLNRPMTSDSGECFLGEHVSGGDEEALFGRHVASRHVLPLLSNADDRIEARPSPGRWQPTLELAGVERTGNHPDQSLLMAAMP